MTGTNMAIAKKCKAANGPKKSKPNKAKPKKTKSNKANLKKGSDNTHSQAQTKESAENAIKEITDNGDGTFSVTMAPSWEGVLPQSDDQDDPACLIIWDDDHCMATVNAFNVAINNGVVPPPWLNVAAGGQFTIPGLKTAILGHVQAIAGGGVVSNVMIAPNTVEQFVSVCQLLALLGNVPFFINHAVCPIGRHFIIKDPCVKNTAVAVACPIMSPPGWVGVGVFA